MLKVYRHHPTPFVFIIIKTTLYFTPFYLALYFIGPSLETKWAIVAHIILIATYALLLIYQTLIFWLDKMVITNQRIVYQDYKFLTVSQESETFIWDIQDIITFEKGLLSYLPFFDYGKIHIETSAADIAIIFKDAPSPEDIRQYIYQIRKR